MEADNYEVGESVVFMYNAVVALLIMYNIRQLLQLTMRVKVAC